MTNFKYIELFAGIGGFRQALDELGGECVFASEIDKFAKQSYTALYDGNHLHDDITKIEASNIPNHDVIVAGIPCQAFSLAGKRLGFEDTRGTLFFDVARIAAEKKPKVVWIENVKGLVGHDKGKTLDTIVKTLNDIGYTVDFEVLNSKYFGVPQNRERIFIIAVRDDLVTPEPWIIEGTTVVPKGKRRISGYEGVKTFNFNWPEEGSVTVRLRDVLEAQVDEKYYLSNDKTAALVAQLEGREGEGDPQVIATGADLSYCLDANYTKGIAPSGINKGRRTHIGEGLPILEATKQGDAVNFQFPDSKTRRGRVGKGIANTLEASSINQGVVEAEGITYNRKDGIGDKRDIAICLSASDWRGLNRNQNQTAILEEFPKYRIRKLTPRECWRLQNFSDEAFDTVKAAGLSDSQLYRQAGNAVTVSVIKAIGERLIPFLASSA